MLTCEVLSADEVLPVSEVLLEALTEPVVPSDADDADGDADADDADDDADADDADEHPVIARPSPAVIPSAASDFLMSVPSFSGGPRHLPRPFGGLVLRRL